MKTGDRVSHKRDPGSKGTITEIDSEDPEDESRVCRVEWVDAPGVYDLQWVEKLYVLYSGREHLT